MAQETELKKDLKTRHITMISIGGVIGAGLFVGSGNIILQTGPAALLSYVIAGLIIVLIMRMLGEMAVVNPDSGSFSTYANNAIGHWAGFMIGWLYWFNWVIIVAIEASLLGQMTNMWFPFIPVWVASAAFPILMMLTNIFSVKSYGEFEYWLATIKVIAIIAFLLVGGAMVFGFFPGYESQGLAIINENGGFFSKGFFPVLLSVVFITYSLSGSEVAAIAVGESENPEKNIIRAINAVVWRLLLFFVGSVALLILIIPQDNEKLLATPYASVFDIAGLPAAGTIMNIIVFISLMSVMNSGLYTASRMVYSLSLKGHAPKIITKVSKKGSPYTALILCVVMAYIFMMFKVISPNGIFNFLANASGGVSLLMYIMVAVSHIILRKRIEKTNPEALKVKMWLFPFLSYVTIIMITVIYVAQVFIESMRLQFFLTSGLAIFSVIAYFLFVYKKEQIQHKSKSA
ncbi:amino acid permease [Bacillus massiliigorillae]|uniref:amino acid permease n=1 Tax=Bacillus massiliigorillae TaxID=1243664 RepID=UPI00039BFE56|nr:amino acid permease [Bacillus massiliigorillae]